LGAYAPHQLDANCKLFDALRDLLTERFEDGWLIQMGLFSMYRDHTGVLVISDELRPSQLN
jgi:hypothetical protein